MATSRINVALLPGTQQDLAKICQRSGLSKTAAVNRAIQLYAYMDAIHRDGKQMVVVGPDGEQVVKVF